MSFLFKKQINHKYANEPYEVAYITNFEDSDGDSIVYLQDVNGGTYSDDGFELNDYGVLSNDIGLGYNVELTKIMRKFMLRKFGEKYMEDCFWNDMGDD